MTAAMRGMDPTDPPKCRSAEWSTNLVVLETNLQRVVTASGWIASGDLFGRCLTKWSTIGSVFAQGAPLKRLQSQEPSTAGWLTPICDLTQCDASFLFFFFLLYSSKKMKTECCVVYDDDRQRVEEPPMLWYQMLRTRSKVQTTSVMKKNPRMRVSKIHKEKKREIGTKRCYISQ